MICWRDRQFCSASVTRCANESCDRYFGPIQQALADVWWRGFGKPDIVAPIDMSDMSEGCPDIVAPYRPFTVTGLDALCHEPEREVEARSPREAAEIYMGDTRERNATLDAFRVSVDGTPFYLVASVDWSATDEA